MKENGLDVPYVFDRSGSATWRFSLAYAPVASILARSGFRSLDGSILCPSVGLRLIVCVLRKHRRNGLNEQLILPPPNILSLMTPTQAPAQKLFALSKLPRWERDAALAAQAAARQDAMAFDTSRLVDFSERIVCSLPASQVVPLTQEPGRFVVTGSRVYFQPLHNLGADNPVRSRPLSAIAAVARRRHVFRPVGIELLFADADEGPRGARGWEARAMLCCAPLHVLHPCVSCDANFDDGIV